MGARIIPVTVENDYMLGAGVPIGSVGSGKDVSLRITFGSSWDGYNKRINWVDAHGENATLTLLTDNLLEDDTDNVYIVPVPSGPKSVQGNMMVTVQGYTISDSQVETVQVTTTAYFKVLPSDWKLDDDESVTPTVAQQLQAAIDAKQDVLTFDDSPTSGSSNPVKSGGVYSAIENAKTYADNAVSAEAARALAAEALKAPLASPGFTGTPTTPTVSEGDDSTKIANTKFVKTAIENAVKAAIDGGSIFVAVYGTSTYSAISEAISAGKMVFLLNGNQIYLYAGAFAQYFCFSAWGEYNTAYQTVTLLDLDHIYFKWACVDTAGTWASGTSEIARTADMTAAIAAETARAVAAEALKAPLASPALSGTPTTPTAATGTSNTQIASTAFVQQEIGAEEERIGISVVSGKLCCTYTE